jgi:hypothetical protein
MAQWGARVKTRWDNEDARYTEAVKTPKLANAERQRHAPRDQRECIEIAHDRMIYVVKITLLHIS